jgi:hypothetical protein
MTVGNLVFTFHVGLRTSLAPCTQSRRTQQQRNARVTLQLLAKWQRPIRV